VRGFAPDPDQGLCPGPRQGRRPLEPDHGCLGGWYPTRTVICRR